MDARQGDDRLKRLREHRVWAERDLSLGFLPGQFQREVARPFKQLAPLAELWQQLVPADLARHARLERLKGGVLHVAVDSSAHLYELDRLMRQGLERELVRAAKGAPLRRVKLSLSSQRITEEDRPG